MTGEQDNDNNMLVKSSSDVLVEPHSAANEAIDGANMQWPSFDRFAGFDSFDLNQIVPKLNWTDIFVNANQVVPENQLKPEHDNYMASSSNFSSNFGSNYDSNYGGVCGGVYGGSYGLNHGGNFGGNVGVNYGVGPMNTVGFQNKFDSQNFWYPYQHWQRQQFQSTNQLQPPTNFYKFNQNQNFKFQHKSGKNMDDIIEISDEEPSASNDELAKALAELAEAKNENERMKKVNMNLCLHVEALQNKVLNQSVDFNPAVQSTMNEDSD